MGYRSDVAIAIKGNTLKKFHEDLEALPEEARNETELLLTKYADTHLKEEGAECWLWRNIKWYTNWPKDYPDVDFIDKFMDEADEEDFYFVRTGEEYDDNEIRGIWWDNPFNITLCREIVLDC